MNRWMHKIICAGTHKTSDFCLPIRLARLQFWLVAVTRGQKIYRPRSMNICQHGRCLIEIYSNIVINVKFSFKSMIGYNYVYTFDLNIHDNQYF